jgi:hypothetical protein
VHQLNPGTNVSAVLKSARTIAESAQSPPPGRSGNQEIPAREVKVFELARAFWRTKRPATSDGHYYYGETPPPGYETGDPGNDYTRFMHGVLGAAGLDEARVRTLLPRYRKAEPLRD